MCTFLFYFAVAKSEFAFFFQTWMFLSGRVERFNRTVVAYFRTQFVDTRDWPSMLGEFYYKYNNRVNKSTKPMTPYQRFFKRPNFSAVLEEQVIEFKNGQIVWTYYICIFKRYLLKSLYCNSMNRRIKFCWKSLKCKYINVHIKRWLHTLSR